MAMARDPYQPLASFAAPARGRDELWRIAATLIVSSIAFVVLGQIVIGLVIGALGQHGSAAILALLANGRTPPGVVLMLAGALPQALALGLALRLFHDRGWTSLLGPAALTARTLLWVGGAVLLMQLALLPLQVIAPSVGRHLTLDQQLPWVLPALAGILLQSGTEEALFRGYLLQQLASKSRSPWVWMVLPTALFALLHYDPDVNQALQTWTIGSAFLFGLAAADITARSGTLGPAIALHAVSNLFGILVLGLYGRTDGLALWNLVLNPMRPWDALPYMAIDALAILVAWLLARLVLRV